MDLAHRGIQVEFRNCRNPRLGVLNLVSWVDRLSGALLLRVEMLEPQVRLCPIRLIVVKHVPNLRLENVHLALIDLRTRRDQPRLNGAEYCLLVDLLLSGLQGALLETFDTGAIVHDGEVSALGTLRQIVELLVKLPIIDLDAHRRLRLNRHADPQLLVPRVGYV